VRPCGVQRGTRRQQAARPNLPAYPTAVLGVAHPQGIEGLVMAGPSETLGVPCHTPMMTGARNGWREGMVKVGVEEVDQSRGKKSRRW
jgi:hypothetical protein